MMRSAAPAAHLMRAEDDGGVCARGRRVAMRRRDRARRVWHGGRAPAPGQVREAFGPRRCARESAWQILVRNGPHGGHFVPRSPAILVLGTLMPPAGRHTGPSTRSARRTAGEGLGRGRPGARPVADHAGRGRGPAPGGRGGAADPVRRGAGRRTGRRRQGSRCPCVRSAATDEQAPGPTRPEQSAVRPGEHARPARPGPARRRGRDGVTGFRRPPGRAATAPPGPA